MATTQEQLDEVNAAISRVLLSGQSHGTQTRLSEEAQLNHFFARRDRLEKNRGDEQAAATGIGGLGYICRSIIVSLPQMRPSLIERALSHDAAMRRYAARAYFAQ